MSNPEGLFLQDGVTNSQYPLPEFHPLVRYCIFSYLKKFRTWSVWWRDEFLRIFTIAFLLFLATRGGGAPTVWGNHLHLPNQTQSNLK